METQTQIQEAPVISSRKKEITADYIARLDEHIRQLKEGKADRALEIREFAAMLHVHPAHLSNTIKEVTGQSPGDYRRNRTQTPE